MTNRVYFKLGFLFIIIFILLQRSEPIGSFISELRILNFFFPIVYEERQFANEYRLDYQNGFLPTETLDDDSKDWLDLSLLPQAVVHDQEKAHVLTPDYEGNGEVVITPQFQLESLSGMSFYVFVEDPDLLREFKLYLHKDSNNYFVANINQPLDPNKWNFVGLDLSKFTSVGNLKVSDIANLRFSFKTLLRQNMTVLIDDVRISPDNEYIYDWTALNTSLIQLINFPNNEKVLAFQNYRERVFYPKKIMRFFDGSITAKLAFLDPAKRCGLVIRGSGDAGLWFSLVNEGKWKWQLFGGNDNKELLSEGLSEDISSEISFLWVKLLADGDKIALYLGESLQDLKLVQVVKDANVKPGAAGVVALDRARCFFNNIEIKYDPINEEI